MNVLFLGEGKLAQICLKALIGDDFSDCFHLASTVTSETFYNGFLNEHEEGQGVLFISNASRNEDQILKAIQELEIDVLISVQHKWILSSEVIAAVAGKAFNLHNAKLPDYKGHNTISFAILNDEKEYTVSIHWLAPEVDSGDLILESSVAVDCRDTALSLYRKTVSEVENLFVDFLRLLQRNEVPRFPLNGNGDYFAKDDWAAHKVIALDDDPDLIDRKTRGSYFPPYEPGYLNLSGKKIYLLPDTPDSNTWARQKPLNKSSWDEFIPPLSKMK